MAFNASGKSGEYHYLVEFLLDTTTLRYAEEDISIQTSNLTGHFYEGRLPETGTLARGLGTFLEAKETVETFQVGLDNRDGEIENHIQNFVFANRNVNIWLGEGQSKSNYSLVFPGFVAHPNGIAWDEDMAEFTVVDRRLKDRKTLPEEKFSTDDFGNLQKNASGTPIPIVYGNYASTVAGGIAVPAICTNMAATDKPFKVASHRLNTIDRVLKNGISVAYKNVSLDNASFELNNLAYDATNDIISVNCQGIATVGGTLIEKPNEVLENIYTAYLGLTGTDLNATAFSALIADVQELSRSVINTEVSTETLIGELLNEASVDMRFVGGKYSPKVRSLKKDEVRSLFRDVDIVVDERDKAEFQVELDPERVFANKITSRYSFDPTYSVYVGSYTRQLSTSVAEVSTVVERPMNFNWLYQQSDVEDRVQRELVTFSSEPATVDVTFTNRALLEDIADQIDLTYNVFDERTFQIRSMQTDLASMTTRIRGVDLFLSNIGTWTLDTATHWNTASAIDRNAWGFWLDDDGNASASDNDSLEVSLWL